MGSINISSHCSLSSDRCHWLTSATSIIFALKFLLGTFGIKTGAAGWEASMLPLCFATPHQFFFYSKEKQKLKNEPLRRLWKIFRQFLFRNFFRRWTRRRRPESQRDASLIASRIASHIASRKNTRFLTGQGHITETIKKKKDLAGVELMTSWWWAARSTTVLQLLPHFPELLRVTQRSEVTN